MFPIENMSPIVAAIFLIAILTLGEFISIRTKAWIPSVFVSAALFIAGYWTIFPKDIVAQMGVSNVLATTILYLLIVNMGTLLSFRELLRQWKTVIISIFSILGIILSCFIIGVWLFDINTVIVAVPALVGGIVSTFIMRDGALELGLESLSVFVVLIYVMQGFAGYPLTSIVLKREGRRVLELYRQNKWQAAALIDSDNSTELLDDDNAKMPKLWRWLPNSYNTSFFNFFSLAIVGLCAYLVHTGLKNAHIVDIHPLVLCLLFGVIAKTCGFLNKHPLKRANGFGAAVLILMLFVFNGLNLATPKMLIQLIYPLVALIIITVIGMLIFSTIVGRLLGSSKEMSFAVALTALYGFPADYIITNEVIHSLTKDSKEHQILTAHMLGPMLIGGFISVTIVSVILAGIMVTELKTRNGVSALTQLALSHLA